MTTSKKTNKTVMLIVRMSPADKTKAENKAKSKGVTLSELVRKYLTRP